MRRSGRAEQKSFGRNSPSTSKASATTSEASALRICDEPKSRVVSAAVAAEVVDAFQGQGNVIKKRDDVHKMAQANKAFAHYAW